MQAFTRPFRLPILVLLIVSVNCGVLFGLQEKQASQPKGQQRWSYDDAERQLLLYPRDVFLQYVTLKLAQREGLSVSHLPMLQARTRRQQFNDRNSGVDLFSLFSGSLAVQESLQLDAMTPESRFQQPETSPDQKADSVSVQSLVGPTVKSHPWKEMLGEQSPKVTGLVNFVPADQYYIGFRSVTRMLEVIDGSDLFAKHLYTQSDAGAFVRDTEDRLRTQLAIDTNPLARPFYDLVVKELAITGSDPFVAEGSDVTLLLQFEQPAVFEAQMEQYLKKAEQSTSDVRRTELMILGTAVTHVASPDRRVHVYSCYPAAGIHIRSNSQVALERCLKLIANKPDSPESLGATDEFRYIRTLIPAGDENEDGLIYLSDPFIRQLMGPELKLTEHRRLRCASVMRMIGHGAALFRGENGRWPKSMKEIEDAECLPAGFGDAVTTCPCGGKLELSEDGHHGVCSHHGHADALVPCCENPVAKVTPRESEAYEQFVREYEQYWQTFFDPIAIRVRATPEKYRLETIVLPLINNSMYQNMAMAMQGETFDLSGGSAADSIMSLSFAFAKERLLGVSGWEPPEPKEASSTPERDEAELRTFSQSRNNLKQIILAFHNFHDTYNHFPGFVPEAVIHPGLSWRVQILPYVEEYELYSQFHLDEPWDSAHNKTLIEKMPSVYRPPGAKLKPGHTTYRGVDGDHSIFAKKKVAFRDITDGTTNTVALMDVSVDDAVIWTKPEEIPADPTKILKALQCRFKLATPIAFADGSVRGLNKEISPKTAELLFNIHDGEVLEPTYEVYVPGTVNSMEGDFFGIQRLSGNRLTEFDVYQFVIKGIGSSVGLHVCDSDPTFDLQLTQSLSRLFSNSRVLDSEDVWIGFAIASVTAPVYVNVPVVDAAIVDDFLTKLSEGLAVTARDRMEFGFFALQKDFYEIPVSDSPVHSFVLSFGPVRWRFFYGRVGDQLIVASKLQTIEKLLAAEKNVRDGGVTRDGGEKSHAQLTIHREQWKSILPSMRLSWDEGARNACLDNLGPMTSAARILGAKDQHPEHEAIREQAASLYGGKHFCPCGGHYELDEHGQMTCSVHGNAEKPKQPGPHADNAASRKMLDSFREINVRLSFLEDGLHAVLEIDRTPPK